MIHHYVVSFPNSWGTALVADPDHIRHAAHEGDHPKNSTKGFDEILD